MNELVQRLREQPQKGRWMKEIIKEWATEREEAASVIERQRFDIAVLIGEASIANNMCNQAEEALREIDALIPRPSLPLTHQIKDITARFVR